MTIKNTTIFFLTLFYISCTNTEPINAGYYYSNGLFLYSDSLENISIYDFNKKIASNLEYNDKSKLNFIYPKTTAKIFKVNSDSLALQFSIKSKPSYFFKRLNLNDNQWDSIKICLNLKHCCTALDLFKPCCTSIYRNDIKVSKISIDSIFSLSKQLAIIANPTI